jgi:hypothetical protein
MRTLGKLSCEAGEAGDRCARRRTRSADRLKTEPRPGQLSTHWRLCDDRHCVAPGLAGGGQACCCPNRWWPRLAICTDDAVRMRLRSLLCNGRRRDACEGLTPRQSVTEKTGEKAAAPRPRAATGIQIWLQVDGTVDVSGIAARKEASVTRHQVGSPKGPRAAALQQLLLAASSRQPSTSVQNGGLALDRG